MRAIAAAALIPALVVVGSVYDDAPPPAYTGGFGEPTCADCHFEGPVDDGEGVLRIEGLPESYEPGASYELRLVLTGADTPKGGFELAAREAANGAQTGILDPVDDRTLVTESGGVQYIHHTAAGTQPREWGGLAWAFRWIAPAAAHGEVVFNAAANAADGDGSQFGDHIYTHERRVGRR